MPARRLHGPVGDAAARACVDKAFTYATPHNGIDMAGINVPGWLGANDIDNFNRANMARYLGLQDYFKDEEKDRVDWLPEESFKSEKFFCMIGTNRSDYEVAMGLSRTFSGHGSDGIVRIENASVWGIDKVGKVSEPCATAYAYRSHSGYTASSTARRRTRTSCASCSATCASTSGSTCRRRSRLADCCRVG